LFTGTLFQPVLYHSNFLIGYRFHCPLLGHLWTQQTAEVIVAALLLASNVPCKETGPAKRLVYLAVSAELFAVVERYRFIFFAPNGLSRLMIAALT
jgi:hypothetical protein